jgi:predicted DNA binding CopG/RHH family protein
MPKADAYEQEILVAFDRGNLKSVATKAELERFKTAARATAVKDRRVNIRLSSIDLNDIQVKALEEGMPYQTLIASVLHRFVSGRLVEKAQSAGRFAQRWRDPRSRARAGIAVRRCGMFDFKSAERSPAARTA